MTKSPSNIPYGRQHIDSKDIEAVIHVLNSPALTQGDTINKFENALARYCGTNYAVAVSSGTAALHVANLAMGVREGDIVITSPLSFVASSNSIIYCGGKPHFIDIDPTTNNISLSQLEAVLKKRKVKGIMPVHFAGYPCDLKTIHELAKKNGCFVIEDACHALGAKYSGEKIGSCAYSDMAVFSFHPVKSITTGEGGAILTNSEFLYNKLCKLRNHSMIYPHQESTWYYDIKELGFNYRITDIQCALGIMQLKKIEYLLAKRREYKNIYFELLKKFDEILLPLNDDENYMSSWHLFCIKLKLEKIANIKESIVNYLRSNGIGVQVHYKPIHLHSYYQSKFKYHIGSFPNAENVYHEILSLPLHPSLTKKMIHSVVNTLQSALKAFS